VTIGILSDAHGNLEAFDLTLRVLEDQGVTSVYFLGDAVGYLPGPAVADALVASEIPAVRGNHEAMLLDARLRRDRDDVYRLGETAAAMSDATVEAIRAWPDHRRVEFGFGPALLLHGSPTDSVFGYLYPDTDLSPIAASPALAGVTVFMGNTHRPFVRRSGRTTFVNVGSCGLPRDVGGLGSACIVDDETGDIRILRFDIRAATSAALRRCGPVHPKTLEVLHREASEHVGELVPS
jgi:predicted phosphodiesterase